MSLTTPDLRELPHGFAGYFGRASQILLTGNFYDLAATFTSSVGAGATAEYEFTLNGVVPSDTLVATKPTYQAGLVCTGARVTAANTIKIAFANPTGGAITPTDETYQILAVRREREN